MADKRDVYETLGISKSASSDEIKQAYRKLAKQYHPDVCKEENAEELQYASENNKQMEDRMHKFTLLSESVKHCADGENGDVLTLALHVGFAEGNLVALYGNTTLMEFLALIVDSLAFEEYNGVCALKS